MHGDQDWLAVRMLERPRWHVPVVGYRCSEHPERPAQDRCDRCGRPFCHDCLHHLRRWRACHACLLTLQRERLFQSLPQRLRRGMAEGIAALVIVLVLLGAVGLVQHLLGNAASDANLAATARHMTGVVGGEQTTGQTGHPTLQLSSMAVGGGTGGLQVHGWLGGGGFRPGEAVRVTAVWSSPVPGGTTIIKTIGPFTAKAGPDGGFAVYLDFGKDLPWTTGHPLLQVTALGDQGSRATLRRDDLLVGIQEDMRQMPAAPGH
jgi:hypothetical protein